MREYDVRLVIRTNDREDEPERGEPYYDDEEMGREISSWIESALEDRDDSPYVYWGEVVMREPGVVDGIRPHLPMTPEQMDLRRRMYEGLAEGMTFSPEQLDRLRKGAEG